MGYYETGDYRLGTHFGSIIITTPRHVVGGHLVFLADANSTTTTQWIVLIGVIVTAVGAYAGVRYGRSGKIRRTEAETLWDQNQREKDEMRSDIKELKATADALRAANEGLRQSHYDCKDELSAVRRELVEVKQRLARLEGST